MTRRVLVGASTLCLLLLGPLEAAAQGQESDRADSFRSSVTLADVQRFPALDLSRSTSLSDGMMRASRIEIDPPSQASSDKRSKTTIILGAAVGATAGLFAGGYIGAWIEGDRCNCDDPGLMGALIGAPIGTVVGGILGGFFLF